MSNSVSFRGNRGRGYADDSRQNFIPPSVNGTRRAAMSGAYTMALLVGGREFVFARVGWAKADDARQRFGQFTGRIGRWEVILDHCGECAWRWRATDGEREIASDRALSMPRLAVEDLIAVATDRPRPAGRAQMPPATVRVVVPDAPKPEPEAVAAKPPPVRLHDPAERHPCAGNCGRVLAASVRMCGKCFRAANRMDPLAQLRMERRCAICERPFSGSASVRYCGQACVDEAQRQRRKAKAG